MYETLTFTGGVHKSEEIKKLIEDLGGFILQENLLQIDARVAVLAAWEANSFAALNECRYFGDLDAFELRFDGCFDFVFVSAHRHIENVSIFVGD